MSKEGQLHPTFPAFQRWVIDKLVGIYAHDPNNVVVTILGRWIDQNEEDLRKKGVSLEEWRKNLGPQAVVKALRDKDASGPENGREDVQDGQNSNDL